MTLSTSLSERLRTSMKRCLWKCFVYTIAAFLFARWLISPHDGRPMDGRFR